MKISEVPLIGVVRKCITCGKRTRLDELAGCQLAPGKQEHAFCICDECYERPQARKKAEGIIRHRLYTREEQAILIEC